MGSPVESAQPQVSPQPVHSPAAAANAAPTNAAPATAGAGRKFDGAPVTHMAPVTGWDTEKLMQWSKGVDKAKDELASKAKFLVEEIRDAALGTFERLDQAEILASRREAVVDAERKLSASLGDIGPKEVADKTKDARFTLDEAIMRFEHLWQVDPPDIEAIQKQKAEVAKRAEELLDAATALKVSAEARHEPTDLAVKNIADAEYLSNWFGAARGNRNIER